jgi:hypothetical protein
MQTHTHTRCACSQSFRTFQFRPNFNFPALFSSQKKIIACLKKKKSPTTQPKEIKVSHKKKISFSKKEKETKDYGWGAIFFFNKFSPFFKLRKSWEKKFLVVKIQLFFSNLKKNSKFSIQQFLFLFFRV